MASEVEICANALRDLGEDPITSLTDDTERARLCNALYGQTRDAVLRAYPWNFAITRQKLARESAAPAYEYAYQYALPTDPYALKVLDLYEGNEWKIEGRKLLTDSDTATIRYIARVTDTAQFDSLFVEALTARLSSRFAYPTTGNANLTDMFWSIYETKLKEARSADAQEGTPYTFESNVLTDVR